MWAYFQWNGVKHRRPDLRSVASWFERRSKMVRLELNVEESRVLLSDHETWHYVLNDRYLPLSEEDGQVFEAANHPDELACELKLKSWARCLDMNFHARNISAPRDDKTIQATFWKLCLEDVASVRKFQGRGAPKIFAPP